MLYGPGLPRLPDSHLPAAVSNGVPPPYKTGKMLQSPDAFDSCDFVDENLVMRQYSSVTDNRCMENMKFDKYVYGVSEDVRANGNKLHASPIFLIICNACFANVSIPGIDS